MPEWTFDEGIGMTLNKQKGNMYDWVTHTYNPIKGKCPHDCVYCYMKRFPQKPARLVESELNDDLGEGNMIFVGSSIDMWAKEIHDDWIIKVLAHCNIYPENTYLFQSKNPDRFWEFSGAFPPLTILGITLETNREDFLHKAMPRKLRAESMAKTTLVHKMITIEPIMDFDLELFVKMIKSINPAWINIGADSKNHNLPEPSRAKVDSLIIELKKFTEVKKKSNLERLK